MFGSARRSVSRIAGTGSSTSRDPRTTKVLTLT
jgi:hypothetical protein